MVKYIKDETESGKILREVNKCIEGLGHICGGAIRSYIEGNLPRDIDVVLIDNKPETLNTLLHKIDTTFLMSRRSVYCKDSLTSSGIATEYNYKGTIVSIIHPRQFYGRDTFGRVGKIVDDIDIDICRLGMAWDNKIVTGHCESFEDIVKSINNREFSFVKIRPDEHARNIKRIAKYNSYGYTLKENNENSYNG